MNQKYINKIIHDDALKFLPKLKANSIDIVLTDPPYFLDKMDHKWSAKKVRAPKKPYAVTHLPAGMKFTKEQGKEFYSWYLKISKGSGTTALACKEQNCRFIGVEINKQYIDIALKRLNWENQNQTEQQMFFPG